MQCFQQATHGNFVVDFCQVTVAETQKLQTVYAQFGAGPAQLGYGLVNMMEDCRTHLSCDAGMGKRPLAGPRAVQTHWLVVVTSATGNSMLPVPPPTSTLMCTDLRSPRVQP